MEPEPQPPPAPGRWSEGQNVDYFHYQHASAVITVNSFTFITFSFSQRLLHWLEILDPTLLIASEDKLDNAKALYSIKEHRAPGLSGDIRETESWRLFLTSVHPDTGKLIPLPYRPPAFLPVGAPLIVAALLPHRGPKPAFFWQLLLQTYTAAFSMANNNSTNQPEQYHSNQWVLTLAAISSTTILGSVPQIAMKKYGLNSPAMQIFFRKIVPAPLMAMLAAYNVAITRLNEVQIGIEVVDKNGNVVGVSEKAGAKAVRETAVSRALLFGTTALVPIVLLHFLESTRFILQNPFTMAPIRHISAVVAFGLMIPISFSVFPQTGKIQRKDVESKIMSATEEQELFYNRGL